MERSPRRSTASRVRPRPSSAGSTAAVTEAFARHKDAQNVEKNVNGKDVTAAPDETIWQVAEREGVEIPHLCYLPEPGYRADGNCRACMVEIEGERVLAASCIRKISDIT